MKKSHTDQTHEHNEDHDEDHHEDSETFSAQYYILASSAVFILCLATLFAVPLLTRAMGKSPRLRNFARSNKTTIINIFMALGGGALFGLAMLDILPSLRERIAGIYEGEYPVAEYSILLTTFLFAMIDASIQRCFRIEHSHHIVENPEEQDESHCLVETKCPSVVASTTECSLGGELDCIQKKAKTGKVTRIIAGLSLHSVLTGLSIGLVGSNAGLAAGLVAVAPHKVAVLLLLSTMLLEVEKYSRIIHAIVFSCALPLGILLSIAVSSIEQVWVLATFEAVGCGAVFYVAIIEMIPEALVGDNKIFKYFMILVGITSIALVQLSHSHSHGHDGNGHGHHENENHEPHNFHDD